MTQISDSSLPKKPVSQSIDDIVSRVDGLFDVARPEAVFAPPVTVDGRTVISAAEVLVGMGIGGGGGPSPATEGQAEGENAGMGMGMGAGGGGGGYAQSRPVAVIIIDGDGVRVEPVVDVTKLGLAAITVLGSMFFFLARMMRGSRDG